MSGTTEAGAARSSAPADRRALVAIDLGAESCRVSLLRWKDGAPHIEMVHRFPNAAVERAGDHGPELRWDIERIWCGLETGLRRCAEIADEGIASIAADGWAVDYVRLGSQGKPLADPFCYRDPRTIAAEKAVHDRISPDRLYAIAGVQQSRINTLYQLFADQASDQASEPARQQARWLNLPEYILHRLGAKPVAEYTNATHSGMVDLATRGWSPEIFAAAGLDLAAAPTIVPPGSIIGQLSGDLAGLPAFRNTLLIAPACHDTASAIAGIPAAGSDWAYISSGTWSLVGTLLPAAINNAEALRGNYTNLGAAGGGACFHKNVNGMWLLRQCMEQWYRTGGEWTIPGLVSAAEALPPPDAPLDLADETLLLPGDMPAFINAQRSRLGLAPLPADHRHAPLFASLIFHSLAARYAEVFADIARIGCKAFAKIHIVGGGSRNSLVNRLTQQATGIPVAAAAVESSTLGNFAVQLAALEGAFVASFGVDQNRVAAWARSLSTASVPQ